MATVDKQLHKVIFDAPSMIFESFTTLFFQGVIKVINRDESFLYGFRSIVKKLLACEQAPKCCGAQKKASKRRRVPYKKKSSEQSESRVACGGKEGGEDYVLDAAQPRYQMLVS